MQKQRIEFIDLAKGICILLVVVLHVVPSFEESIMFAACFRMPLYFCLSGLFYKDYDCYGSFTLKKINRILIPFIAWYLIGYSIYYLGRAVMPSNREATFHIYDVFVQNEIFNLPIWFLLCLFWCNIVFGGIRKLTKVWYLELFAVIIFASIGWWMNAREAFNFLYIGSAMTSLPFFYFGFMLKRSAILYPDYSKKKSMIFFILSIAAGLIFALIPSIPPHFEYYTNRVVAGSPAGIYLSAFLLVAGLLLGCKLVGRLPYISWLGRYSIIVLVTHMWLRDLIFSGLAAVSSGLGRHNIVVQIFCLLLIVTLMAVIIPFCRKYLPYITAQKDLITVNRSEKRYNETI